MLYRVLVEEKILCVFETVLEASSKDELDEALRNKLNEDYPDIKALDGPTKTCKIRKITNVEQEDNKNVSPA